MHYFRTPGYQFGDVHVHDEDFYTGVSKYFEAGAFSGFTMTYYYLQRGPGEKQNDYASEVFSIWENLDDIFAFVSENPNALDDVIPVTNHLMVNTLLLTSRQIAADQIEAWLWPARLTDPNSQDYILYVPVKNRFKLTEDIFTTNMVDINKANPATQNLIRFSMALDQEFTSGRIGQVRQSLR